MLRYNPWHSLVEHRPLGNSNRARRRMYAELAELRQRMNSVEHVEPTGDEEFPGSSGEGPRETVTGLSASSRSET